MDYRIEDYWLKKVGKESDCIELVNRFCQEYKAHLLKMNPERIQKEILSGMNRIKRGHLPSSRALGFEAKVGDIVYCDLGHQYLYESSFQHPCLVLGVFHSKLFVVPMTSNPARVAEAINVVGGTEKRGKSNLFSVGQPEGMHRPSALFLNDARHINSAHIISVRGHIDPQSDLFKLLIGHLQKHLFHS